MPVICDERLIYLDFLSVPMLKVYDVDDIIGHFTISNCTSMYPHCKKITYKSTLKAVAAELSHLLV